MTPQTYSHGHHTHNFPFRVLLSLLVAMAFTSCSSTPPDDLLVSPSDDFVVGVPDEADHIDDETLSKPSAFEGLLIDEMIPRMIHIIEAGDVETLEEHVQTNGLVIAPYGVGVAELGLTDRSLKTTLKALWEGAQPEVISFEAAIPHKIGMVVKGLNQVEILPAVGDPVTMTDPAYIAWKTDHEGNWRLWLVAADESRQLSNDSNTTPILDSESSPRQVPDLDPELVRAIEAMFEIFRKGDADLISQLVSEGGLIVAPYAVGAPDQGLKGQALQRLIDSLFKAADLHLLAVEIGVLDNLGFIVDGLKHNIVEPAVGDPLPITNPAYFGFRKEDRSQWRWWLLATDPEGLLRDQVSEPPFIPWD